MLFPRYERGKNLNEKNIYFPLKRKFVEIEALESFSQGGVQNGEKTICNQCTAKLEIVVK